MVSARSTLLSFDANTKKLIMFSVLFTYVIGQLVRVPLYDDILVAIVFSFVIDTLVVSLMFGYVAIIMTSKATGITAFTIVVTLVSSSICSIIIIAISSLIRSNFPAVANVYQTRPLLIFGYFTLLFGFWGIGAFWIKIQTRAAEEAVHAANAERAAAVAEVRRLRMQLDPHFLFNSLNTALIEVDEHPKVATTLLREMSAYFRYALDTAETHFVPLSAELTMLRSYLKVLNIRSGEKLKFSVAADDEAKRRHVPALLLQPLVENAAKHGVPDNDNILHIRVAAEMRDGDLVLTVTNTGDLGNPRPRAWGTGTGLTNLRARLALHYPDRHSFEMIQAGPNVCATCVLKGEPC